MSTSRPLPEAVRGCWYYLSEPLDAEDGDDPHQVVSFGVDGSFVRYERKKKSQKKAETGDYTFDGNFLILRGRRTHTFRVHRPAFWRWRLEGKKKNRILLRGLCSSDEQREKLPSEERRDIGLLPLRARVESDFEGDNHDTIHRLIYEHGAQDRRLLATFCAERPEKHHLWVGLTPFVRGVKPKTWQRIVRESYLGLFLGEPNDVSAVTVHFFDSHESVDFEY